MPNNVKHFSINADDVARENFLRENFWVAIHPVGPA